MINSSFYIFGNFGSGHTQFPNDYTQKLFKKISSLKSLTTCNLIIHREEDLVYYIYLRKFGKKCHIGLCSILNSVMASDISDLITIFDQTLNDFIKDKQIFYEWRGGVFDDIDFNDFKIRDLAKCPELIKKIASVTAKRISSLRTKKLQPINYGVERWQCKECRYSEFIKMPNISSYSTIAIYGLSDYISTIFLKTFRKNSFKNRLFDDVSEGCIGCIIYILSFAGMIIILGFLVYIIELIIKYFS